MMEIRFWNELQHFKLPDLDWNRNFTQSWDLLDSDKLPCPVPACKWSSISHADGWPAGSLGRDLFKKSRRSAGCWAAATFLSRILNLIYEVSLGQVGSGQAADQIKMLRYENNDIGWIACQPAAVWPRQSRKSPVSQTERLQTRAKIPINRPASCSLLVLL